MITQEQLLDVSAIIKERPLSDEIVFHLRGLYPSVHFTYCMDDDVVGPAPVLEESGFNLYLVDTSDHCYAITADKEIATGIVVKDGQSVVIGGLKETRRSRERSLSGLRLTPTSRTVTIILTPSIMK